MSALSTTGVPPNRQGDAPAARCGAPPAIEPAPAADWVRIGAHRAWSHLPVLVAASLSIGVTVWFCLNLGGYWLAAGLLLVVLLPVPLAVGLILTSAALIEGDAGRIPWRERSVAIPRLALLCAAALLAGLLAMIAVQAHAAAPSPASLAVMVVGTGGAVAALVLVTGAVPLLAVFGRTRIRSALVLTLAGLAKAPLPVVAAAAGLALGVHLALSWPILWAVLPGVCLLTVHAAGWTTAAALALHPTPRGIR